MSHKPWKLLLSFWATCLALFTLAADSNAQETFANDRLVVVGRQTGLILVYNTKNGRLISKLDNGLRTGQTFLNDTTFAPDGSAYVTDSINPVLYRVARTGTGQYALQEFLKFEGTPVTYVNAPGAEGINVNGIVATSDGRYLIIGKRNENMLFRIDPPWTSAGQMKK